MATEKGEKIVFDGSVDFSYTSSDTNSDDCIGYIDGVCFGNEEVHATGGIQNMMLKDNYLEDLQKISGVGKEKAKILYEAGYISTFDVQKASQEELADIDGIGNALAARIKADVGGVGIDAKELVEELQGNEGVEFLEEETLMVNIYE